MWPVQPGVEVSEGPVAIKVVEPLVEAAFVDVDLVRNLAPALELVRHPRTDEWVGAALTVEEGDPQFLDPRQRGWRSSQVNLAVVACGHISLDQWIRVGPVHENRVARE